MTMQNAGRGLCLTWGRFVTVLAIGAAPTLLAIAAYRRAGRGASVVTAVHAACGVTPGV